MFRLCVCYCRYTVLLIRYRTPLELCIYLTLKNTRRMTSSIQGAIEAHTTRHRLFYHHKETIRSGPPSCLWLSHASWLFFLLFFFGNVNRNNDWDWHNERKPLKIPSILHLVFSLTIPSLFLSKKSKASIISLSKSVCMSPSRIIITNSSKVIPPLPSKSTYSTAQHSTK